MPLELVDLLRHLGRLLPQELRLRLSHGNDLLHLREALLQGHELLLLGLLQRPELLGLALQPGVDLLHLGGVLDSVFLGALKLLLSLRRVVPQPLGIRKELNRVLLLLLGGHLQLLDLLLLELGVFHELHVQLLQLLEVGRRLLHVRLDLVVVAEVGVVRLLYRHGLLLELLHALPVLLHVAGELLLLGLQPGLVAVVPPRLGLGDEGLQLQPLGLRRDPRLGLSTGAVQALALALGDAQPIQLLLPLLGQLLDDALGLLDGLNQPVRADDVLEVLEEALLVGGERLRLHEGDLLDLTLQDQEPVVLQVDPALLQKLRHLCEVAALAVDVVLRLVVLEGLSADRETRPLDDLVVLWAGAGVDDVLEGHGHLGAPTVRQGPGGMDQLRHLVQTHLLCPLPEDEQKGVDGVGLAAAVRADDGGETFVEGADDLLVPVGLEVL
mmetsp:Transcript_60707/g.170075  ORF Transcript_60707/g.170075 Transcript_60707/m.170075 type:complete len:440 (+) Transcript_60707:2898-4217(+)